MVRTSRVLRMPSDPRDLGATPAGGGVPAPTNGAPKDPAQPAAQVRSKTGLDLPPVPRRPAPGSEPPFGADRIGDEGESSAEPIEIDDAEMIEEVDASALEELDIDEAQPDAEPEPTPAPRAHGRPSTTMGVPPPPPL